MKDKLKPCPFCGEKGTYGIGEYTLQYLNDFAKQDLTGYWITCKCGGRISRRSKHGVIQAWNRRQNDG